MKPIYKKKEAGLNWMNLLASSIGLIVGVYFMMKEFYPIEVCFTFIMLLSFILNFKEYKRLNKIGNNSEVEK